MEKYKSRSIEELMETLKVLSEGRNSTGLSAEMREFVCMLKAHKLRHMADAHAFYKCGGMRILLDLLSTCEANSRDMVVVMGTLGNLCALHQHSRSSVSECKKNLCKKIYVPRIIYVLSAHFA